MNRIFYRIVLAVLIFNLSSCSKNKSSKFLSFHPIEFKLIKSEPLSDKYLEERKSKDPANVISIVCGETLTFKFIEKNLSSPDMPRALIKKAEISFKNIPFSEAIDIMSKKCKLKIMLQKDIQDIDEISFDCGVTSFYMIFHQISFWNCIGWGVKNNVVYFGRNLKNMDFIGAQYSDLNEAKRSEKILTNTLQ